MKWNDLSVCMCVFNRLEYWEHCYMLNTLFNQRANNSYFFSHNVDNKLKANDKYFLTLIFRMSNESEAITFFGQFKHKNSILSSQTFIQNEILQSHDHEGNSDYIYLSQRNI